MVAWEAAGSVRCATVSWGIERAVIKMDYENELILAFTCMVSDKLHPSYTSFINACIPIKDARAVRKAARVNDGRLSKTVITRLK